MRHEKAGALLSLARHLASSAEGITLDEMAAVAGTGRRTAERLRDAMWQLFPQMEELPEGTVKRFRIRGGLDGFFQTPTTEELLELTNHATSLRHSGYHDRAEAVLSLERKVRSAMKSPSLRRLATDVDALARAELTVVRAGPRPFQDPQVLAAIRYAVGAIKAVRFRYLGGSSPGQVRTVTPYGVLFERMNYLVGAELGRDQPRNWRLDRVRDLEVTDLSSSAPEEFDLVEFASQSFGIYHDELEEVVLRVLPHGVEDATSWRFHAKQTLTPQDDGSVIIRFRSGGMLELAWHLFTWGDKLEIVSPPRLQAAMDQALRQCQSRLPRAIASVPVVDGA